MFISKMLFAVKIACNTLLLALLATGAIASEAEYIINGNNVNIRSGAGTNFSVVTKGQQGEKIVVLQEGDPWVQVRFAEKNISGWVHRSLVTVKKKIEPTKQPSLTTKTNLDGVEKKELGDGIVYTGQMDNGVPHGKGELIQKNGIKYSGDFAMGKFRGKGVLIFPNNIQYTGNFIDDFMEGQGTLSVPDNLTYTGNFKENHYHGKGKVVFANGNSYEGEFSNSLFNGQGTYTFADGEVIFGQWKDGKIVKEMKK